MDPNSTYNSSNQNVLYSKSFRNSYQIINLENDILDSLELDGEGGKKYEFDEETKKKLNKKGENSTCKIITKTQKGTGFFCNIPFNGKNLKVLFTSYNILEQRLLQYGNTIKLAYKNKIKKIKLTKDRMICYNSKLDYSCIEILKKDNIEDFFEIEYEKYENYDDEYSNEDISILEYPNRGYLKVMGGNIEKIIKHKIEHSVITFKGSSGAPIILLLRDLKVIGIHKGFDGIKQINYGIFMKNIIEDINRNYFICEYNIEKKSINKNVSLFNYDDGLLYNFFFGSELQNYCELYLNQNKINFSYYYNFPKEGKYKLKVILKCLLTDLSFIFHDCSNLKSLNLSNLNSVKVTNMKNMFSVCSSLTSINFSNINTTKVTNMEKMFYKCSSLISLDLSNFNTSNVTDMSWMFSSCSSLTNLDLSNFDTKNVTDMNNMFSECSSLISVNLSNFNTSKVESMYSMFFECTSLTSLDLSNFDTSNIESLYFIFYNCSSLTNINLSNFNTEHVENMNGMFCGCSSLINLDLSCFNTCNVINMRKMFYNCHSLSTLNLSNFNTCHTGNMDFMFFGCYSLTSLDLLNFSTCNLSKMDSMFNGIKKICSLNCKNKIILDAFKKKL